MSDNLENIVLEHLWHIRSRVDQKADDMHELKHEVAHGDETDARQQGYPTP